MKQPSFIDAIEAQREYIKAVQAGYGFTRHGNKAHYLFRADQLEPTVLDCMPPMPADSRRPYAARDDGKAPFYIWTFIGCTMASHDAGKMPAVITPIDDASEWTRRAPV